MMYIDLLHTYSTHMAALLATSSMWHFLNSQPASQPAFYTFLKLVYVGQAREMARRLEDKGAVGPYAEVRTQSFVISDQNALGT